jgi:hypothetical protein
MTLFFLDIQEFYETTLMNETKSTQQKTREAHQMSTKFQNQLSFYGRRTDAATIAGAGQITSAGGLISVDDLLASPALSKQQGGFPKNGFGDGDDFAKDILSASSPKNARPSHSSIPSQVISFNFK